MTDYQVRQIACLAVNAFFEARNQDTDGRAWVMHVVKNRIDSPQFPKEICGVVKDRKAFAWHHYLGRIIDKDEMNWFKWVLDEYGVNDIEINALVDSFYEAYHFFIEWPEDITGGALYYFTTELWESGVMDCHIKDYKVSGVFKDHIFFNYILWSMKPC